MTKFEEIFAITPGHMLKEVHAHYGSYDDAWRHEEYDERGELVARYESWDQMPPRGVHRAGWRKYGPDGALLEEHDDLPL